ncbi:epoxide hydrolase family protein [Streptomyces sp. NBC_00268]|uniref:epoxide hydrolase family protein n=1 Tax=Streptomyces sp. NBC_00268 TaxID=2975695 RepID=UPI002253FE8D|nr:epoxide hydrolase [Streptomyces sp. NBC_00268]MCX5190922.1 epoxide hydrolase 1 [Streptomyces sp. NBC_00268]
MNAETKGNEINMSAISGTPAIRPFTFEFSDAELEDLRARIKAVRWPEKETVADQSQGVQLETMKELARYWAEEYDWRKVEAKLKALPHFITEIDGLDIHFIHVRSEHEDALPLIVTHGWPGSVVEQLKIIDPLLNPTAHGGSASDAFHVVIPSMPGYGFSGKPTTTGWGPERIARAWGELMKRPGYTKYAAQGGDWGAIVTDLMGAQEPEGPASSISSYTGPECRRGDSNVNGRIAGLYWAQPSASNPSRADAPTRHPRTEAEAPAPHDDPGTRRPGGARSTAARLHRIRPQPGLDR